MSPKDAIQLAEDRPTGINDDLCQWAMDAEEAIRELADEVTRRRVELEAPQPPARGPLILAVIGAARLAMDASFEAGNDAMDITIPSHLAAALSLRLDEYDRAHGITGDAA